MTPLLKEYNNKGNFEKTQFQRPATVTFSYELSLLAIITRGNSKKTLMEEMKGCALLRLVNKKKDLKNIVTASNYFFQIVYLLLGFDVDGFNL